MSNLSISLIIGSIFIVTLCQTLLRYAAFGQSVSFSQVLLACGLLYCAMKILTSWLGAPPPRSIEDEKDDHQNEK